MKEQMNQADERQEIIYYLGNTSSNKIDLTEASLRCLHGEKMGPQMTDFLFLRFSNKASDCFDYSLSPMQ